MCANVCAFVALDKMKIFAIEFFILCLCVSVCVRMSDYMPLLSLAQYILQCFDGLHFSFFISTRIKHSSHLVRPSKLWLSSTINPLNFTAKQTEIDAQYFSIDSPNRSTFYCAG